VADLRGFMLNGLDAAWIDDSTRQRWRTDFMQAFDLLASDLTQPPGASA
jgi:adenosine deaminase